jgi:hypothetical protein
MVQCTCTYVRTLLIRERTGSISSHVVILLFDDEKSVDAIQTFCAR